MNIDLEIVRMIDEMRMRTGRSPAKIICNQETLGSLCGRNANIYVRKGDVETGGGYVARYMEIPILISPEVETGKILLIPEQNSTDNQFRTEYVGRPFRYGIDFEPGTDSNQSWWIRNSLSADDDWPHIKYCPSAPQPSAGSTSLNEAEGFITKLSDEYVKRVAKAAISLEDEINEDSFMAILKGNSD